MALLGLAGGYLTPVLLSTGENHMWTWLAILAAESGSAGDRAREALARAGVSGLAGHGDGVFGVEPQMADRRYARGGFGWLSIIFVVFFAASVVGSRLWLLAANTGPTSPVSYSVLDHPYHAWRWGLSLWRWRCCMAGWRKRFGAASEAWVNSRQRSRVVLLTLAIPIQFVGFRITMLWALEAAALAWVGGALDQATVSSRGLAGVCVGLRSAAYAWMPMYSLHAV